MTAKRFEDIEVSADLGWIRLYTSNENYVDYDGDEVLDMLNHLYEENKELKYHIKKLEKELHLAHMSAMFSTVKSFNGDVSKRYYYSEKTDEVYDTANHYGQYNKILDKKEIAMLLNEYETMLNGDDVE